MRVVLAAFAALLLAAPAAGQDRAPLRGGQGTQDYRGEARKVAQEVEDLRAELIRLAGAQALDERSAGRKRRKLAALRKQEAELTASLGRNRTQLARLLGSLQLYQRDPPPPLFVHARSARDAARAAVLMKSVTPELAARGKVLSARAEAIRKVRREATAASEDLLLTESELEERRSEVERLLAEKSGLERRLLADADAAEQRARALATQAGSLGELVDGLAALDPRPVRSGPMRLVQPVQGQIVTRFGQQRGPAPTRGVVWRTQGSAQVLAPTDARVEYVGPLKGYGLIVILRPEEGTHVVLSGLDQAASGAGRRVAAGEPIGRMAGGGSELYLEVRREGAPVDPARWLAAPLRRSGRSTG